MSLCDPRVRIPLSTPIFHLALNSIITALCPKGHISNTGWMSALSVFDKVNRLRLQEDVIARKVDPDTLLPDLVDWVICKYYNLFYNKKKGEHHACLAARKGNAAYALCQSFKKRYLIALNLRIRTSAITNSSHLPSYKTTL